MAANQDIQNFATVIMAAKTQELGTQFFSYLDHAIDAFVFRNADKDGKIDPQLILEFKAAAIKEYLATVVPGMLACASTKLGGPYEGEALREYFQEFFNTMAKSLGSFTPDFSFIVHVATNAKTEPAGPGTVQDSQAG